jgi:hypothetical protein
MERNRSEKMKGKPSNNRRGFQNDVFVEKHQRTPNSTGIQRDESPANVAQSLSNLLQKLSMDQRALVSQLETLSSVNSRSPKPTKV